MTVAATWWSLFSFLALLSFAGVFYGMLPPPRTTVSTASLLRYARWLPVYAAFMWLVGMPVGGWPGVPAQAGVPSALWDLVCVTLFAAASAMYAIAEWLARGQK